MDEHQGQNQPVKEKAEWWDVAKHINPLNYVKLAVFILLCFVVFVFIDIASNISAIIGWDYRDVFDIPSYHPNSKKGLKKISALLFTVIAGFVFLAVFSKNNGKK